ncbi:etoposide-induced protein 2.4-domain-containing protein [Chiua virens]|nr:etoposide-induced protein 2.4-domain-containing protein [Chiua virens]
MSVKKSSSAAKTPKKTAARPAAAHPSWIDMIKVRIPCSQHLRYTVRFFLGITSHLSVIYEHSGTVLPKRQGGGEVTSPRPFLYATDLERWLRTPECIAANPEESRQGVSRPHIKKYVEEQYNLQIGNAQNTQLARAIATGAEKGIFVLPKGPAGKVKLPPKNARPVDTSASKENKPAKVATTKPAVKAKPTKAGSARATSVRTITAKKVVAKTKTVTAAKAAPKKAAEKKVEATKATKAAAAKLAAAKAPKKVLAGKKVAPAKKTTAPSKRGSAKKAVTGSIGASRAKAAAAKKAPVSKKAPASRSVSKKVPSKKVLRSGTVQNNCSAAEADHLRGSFMSTRQHRQHRSSSSRATYPVFLSLHETLWIHAKSILRGLLDAFRWDIVIWTASSDTEIRNNLLKSVLLNALSLASIHTFNPIFQPLIHDHPNWLHRNLGLFYTVLWLLPVAGVSLYLNISWCNIIAKRTFMLQHGNRAPQPPPVTYTGFLKMLATKGYRAVMALTTLIVSFGLTAIPYGGPVIGFAFMCWLDAFIWIARGLSLSSSVRYLEERWPYFFAFGFPCAAICTWGSGLANAALFALLFPAYVIMAMHARPIPQDPYNPQVPSEKNDAVRYPSPLIPIRLPIFAAVIWLNDLIARILYLGGSIGEPRHKRAPSNASEKAEEGAGIQLHRISPGKSKQQQQQQALNPGRPVERKTVRRSDRRKRD